MKKIECKYMDIFMSKDLFDDYMRGFSRFAEFMRDFSCNEDSVASGLEQKVVNMINNEEAFRRYIDIYSRFEARGRVAALYAEEGCIDRGESNYLDGRRIKRVQGWIDKNDGKYGCLVILWNDSTNGPYKVKSKKSLVFTKFGASFHIHSPIAKEIIDADTIDYHLKQLRKRVKANANG